MESMNAPVGLSCVEAALLIGLFWAALAHPERIRHVAKFRLSLLCLCVALVAPALTVIFLFTNPIDTIPGRNLSGVYQIAGLYLHAIPPVLISLAVLLGVGSVLHKSPSANA
jgi:hypothetical protein